MRKLKENSNIKKTMKNKKNIRSKTATKKYDDNIYKNLRGDIRTHQENKKITINRKKNILHQSDIPYINDKDDRSLGINIGASKTVYSIFSKINDKYVSNVLLMNNTSRIIPSIICYTKDHRLFGDNSISSLKQNLNNSYNNLSRLIGYNKNDNILVTSYKIE